MYHQSQTFVQSDSEKHLLWVEDLFVSRPHLFPGLYVVYSGTSLERFRSGPEKVGSEGSYLDKIARLEGGSASR